MSKRVLIIVYYWPPAGGSGVQRWVKFVKYFKEFGWEPVVYTVKDGEYPVEDDSLAKEIPDGVEVMKEKIWEPYGFYKKFTGKRSKVGVGFISKGKKVSFKEKVSIWLRGNFFIPDARKYWIKPAVKSLTSYLKDNPVDAIVTTGPPHTCHMIGLGLKKNTGIPWISDFRDPWTGIYYFKDLMLTKRSVRKHKRMEQDVLDHSDRIVTVGETMKRDYGAMTKTPIEVITNGYDAADYPDTESKTDEKFDLVQIGMLMKSQNPVELWDALKELVEEEDGFKDDLELKVIGKLDGHVMASIEEAGLSGFLNMIDYVPHEEVVHHQRSAQVLLLPINKVPNAGYLLTGKLFEYLAARRPILCIGPEDGDAAKVIRECKAGDTVGFGEKEKLKNLLKRYYSEYKNGGLKRRDGDFTRFSRRNLTERYAGVLEGMISGT